MIDKGKIMMHKMPSHIYWHLKNKYEIQESKGTNQYVKGFIIIQFGKIFC